MTAQTLPELADPAWRGLYRAGGIAALLAGVLFRRNIAAEIGLFVGGEAPASASDWFALLQSNRWLGLAYLNFFDVVNYALLAVMFLALYAALRREAQGALAVAAGLAFLGITSYFAANTAFSMLALSQRFAAAATAEQRAALLAAGEALLALNRFTGPDSQPGAGGLLSLLFIALASLLTALVMLRSRLFGRAAGYVGLLAGGLDLAYCLAFVFLPGVDGAVLALAFIPAAGLFWMAWHILVGWRLYRLGSSAGQGERGARARA